MKTAKHASEGGHWYTSEGEQVVEVEGARGQPVKPDVRHARKLDLAPGVTTIIRAAAAPGLERWKRQQAVLAALTLPRTGDEDDSTLLRQIEADADAHAKDARDKGTAFHAAYQAHVEGRYDGRDGWGPWVSVTEAELVAWGVENGAAELGVAHPLGYGTKADLIGGGWLVDFKGKDELTPDSTKLRDEHHMQLAATREALRECGHEIDRCAIGFFSRTSPDFTLVPADEGDLVRGCAMFAALLSFWQVKNRHNPNWGSTAPKE